MATSSSRHDCGNIDRMAVWRRLIRYSAVSVVAVTVSVVTLGVLVAFTGMPAAIANLIAAGAGTIPSFELNRRWVWGKGGRPSISREVGPFVSFTAVSVGLSTTLVHLVERWSSHAGVGRAANTALIELASLTGAGIVWGVQFVVLDRVLFKTDPEVGALVST